MRPDSVRDRKVAGIGTVQGAQHLIDLNLREISEKRRADTLTAPEDGNRPQHRSGGFQTSTRA